MAISLDKYEINRLVAEELTYELTIRGITGVDRVEEGRKTLRNLLRLEKSSTPLDYPAYPIQFVADREALAKCITEATDLVTSFTGQRDTVLAKIVTKLAYALGRANRSKPSTADDKAAKSRLIVAILNLKSKVESKIKRRERSILNQSLGTVDVDLVDEEESSESDEDIESVAPSHTPVAESSRVFQSSGRSVPVSKWDLKYSGEDHSMSLSSFLTRVDELKVARHVSDQELFDSAIDLFTGKALIWYRAMKKNARDWKSLVTLLREQFQPPDYNDRLFDEIRNRTQGNSENMGLYVAIMDSLFDRLTIKVPEATRMKVILRNIAPFYQQQLGLTTPKSREELLEAGRILEARKTSVDSFSPPIPASRKLSRNKLLEPDLAYVGTDGLSCGTTFVNKSFSANVAAGTSSGRQSSTCWNCLKLGHMVRDCPEPRKLLCYRCGKADYTVRTCPHCSKNDRQRN